MAPASAGLQLAAARRAETSFFRSAVTLLSSQWGSGVLADAASSGSGFRWSVARERRIPSRRLRTIVARRLDEALERAS